MAKSQWYRGPQTNSLEESLVRMTTSLGMLRSIICTRPLNIEQGRKEKTLVWGLRLWLPVPVPWALLVSYFWVHCEYMHLQYTHSQPIDCPKYQKTSDRTYPLFDDNWMSHSSRMISELACDRMILGTEDRGVSETNSTSTLVNLVND